MKWNDDFWGVKNGEPIYNTELTPEDKDNIKMVRRYLKEAIDKKSRDPLNKIRSIMLSITPEQRYKILNDEECIRLINILDRKILPDIDPFYTSFGPFD